MLDCSNASFNTWAHWSSCLPARGALACSVDSPPPLLTRGCAICHFCLPPGLKWKGRKDRKTKSPKVPTRLAVKICFTPQSLGPANLKGNLKADFHGSFWVFFGLSPPTSTQPTMASLRSPDLANKCYSSNWPLPPQTQRMLVVHLQPIL